MKLLLFLSVLAIVIGAQAAPTRKRVVWEYATLDLNATRKISSNPAIYKYGAELFLPGSKAVFLESKNRGKPAYNTYLLNRLGAQGWELTEVISYNSTEYRYILKRQK
ncbi:MAG: hypothetical protein EOO38_27005 [Cytophagaceae bacterium]|nr:MAG: hypothetical protein EOO38_27005 [Cytophagaceae bacterium]